MPSILRNSRYRRDQRQLDEEEEMWFNEEEDFDEGEAVVPAAAADIVPANAGKKINIDSPKDPSSPPGQQQSQAMPQIPQQQSILNNNSNSVQLPTAVASQSQNPVSTVTATTNNLPVIGMTAGDAIIAASNESTADIVDKTSSILKKVFSHKIVHIATTN